MPEPRIGNMVVSNTWHVENTPKLRNVREMLPNLVASRVWSKSTAQCLAKLELWPRLAMPGTMLAESGHSLVGCMPKLVNVGKV